MLSKSLRSPSILIRWSAGWRHWNETVQGLHRRIDRGACLPQPAKVTLRGFSQKHPYCFYGATIRDSISGAARARKSFTLNV
jgi:hypothetical protein